VLIASPSPITVDSLNRLSHAARDRSPIEGFTHKFYRYPARFSPLFARAAIELFSSPDDVVLDPYMGGGTTVVEAMAAGRKAIGTDLNELAVFVTRVKTKSLSEKQRAALRDWSANDIPRLSYWDRGDWQQALCPDRTHNLSLPRARPIKKILAIAIQSLSRLPDEVSRDFARCALLNIAQLALNGRKRPLRLDSFRAELREALERMLVEEMCLFDAAANNPAPEIRHGDAAKLGEVLGQASVDLVVTSPPYPGIHMLYHRWQVDGRRETPAPYWIAGCNDGQGASHYTFGDRREVASRRYFSESLRTLRGIRDVMKVGGLMVQLVAFGNPRLHLRRYLQNMEAAGFTEVRLDDELGLSRHKRIWRSVPGRRWHANFKGNLNSAREVVLIHRAS
jgi:DNA modification methylase